MMYVYPRHILVTGSHNRLWDFDVSFLAAILASYIPFLHLRSVFGIFLFVYLRKLELAVSMVRKVSGLKSYCSS